MYASVRYFTVVNIILKTKAIVFLLNIYVVVETLNLSVVSSTECAGLMNAYFHIYHVSYKFVSVCGTLM